MSWDKVNYHTRKHAKMFTTNTWVSLAIKAGYFSRGILYCLIGLFALGVSIGTEKTSPNQKEIFFYILKLPYGHELSIILLIGIAGYSLWGFIRATSDYVFPNRKHIPLFQRLGYIFSGLFYGSLVFLLSSILVNKADNKPQNDTIKHFSSQLFHLPFGQVILFIIGAMGILSGFFEIRKAVKAKKPSDLNYHQDKISGERIFMTISRIGISMRGLLWTILGIFAMIAGLYADPSRVKETNDVFTSLYLLPFGNILVGLIATGFVLFGIYSMSLSFWVSLPNNEKKS